MRILCTKCGAKVAVDDIDLDRMVAKCRRCDEVFSFSLLEEGRRVLAAPARGSVTAPAGIKVEQLLTEGAKDEARTPYRSASPGDARTVVITRRWFRFHHVAMLFFCAIWDGFLVNWYTVTTRGNAPTSFFIFPLIHVAAGVWLTYSTLAGLLNRTVISVSDEALSIRHAPLPWRGERTLPARMLAKLHVEEVISRGRGRSITYALNATLREGTKLPLLSGLASAEAAFFIAQTIEQRLGLDDALDEKR